MIIKKLPKLAPKYDTVLKVKRKVLAMFGIVIFSPRRLMVFLLRYEILVKTRTAS